MNKIQITEGVELEPFHTLFTGQTNLAGKTTAIRSIIPKMTEAGFTVLIFDTKPTVREFPGYHDIPLTYRQTTDPLVLIGLLEAIRHARLGMLYATLGRLTEGAKNITQIIENSHTVEEKARSGFVKDACYQIRDLLIRLDDELRGYSFSQALELRDGKINVMAINGMSSEAQQLVIKTAFELALKHHNRKTILIIDEAFRFLPQDYSSACKRPVQDVVTQGAKTGLFVWLATQFIATTDKDAIKAMANKFLGRQDDPTEIEATIKRAKEEVKLKPDMLMNLKRGEFIFIPLEGQARKIYIPMSNQPTASDSITINPSKNPVVVIKDAPPTLLERKRIVEGKEISVTGGNDSQTRGSNPLPPLTLLKHNLVVPPQIKDSEINLEEKTVVIRITHSEKHMNMTTETQKGQVMYVLVEDFGGQPRKPGEIMLAMAEHGWIISPSVFSTVASSLVGEGLLIHDGPVYRLPKFVKVNVKGEIVA